MSAFLISFPAGAMDVGADEMPAVVDASHAVVRAAKAAGILVFAGGLDDAVPPVVMDLDGTVTDGSYPGTRELSGGFCVVDVATREVALRWAAELAVACRCGQEVRAFMGDPLY